MEDRDPRSSLAGTVYHQLFLCPAGSVYMIAAQKRLRKPSEESFMLSGTTPWKNGNNSGYASLPAGSHGRKTQ